MPPQTTAAARERYLTLIDATLRNALTTRVASSHRAIATTTTMESALPAIAQQLGVANEEIEINADGPALDGAGNVRQVYRPLLMRAVAPALKRRDAFRAYADAVRLTVRSFASASGPLLTFDGATIVARLFEALAIDAIDGPGVESAHAFARVVASQAADGTFLARTSSDQLEPAWYHELAVLHAVRAFADATGDVETLVASSRSARYHAEQVQPDHASSHPFGLAALLDDADGIHLADMMLHAAGVQQPATMDAVSLVLLFDALDCGRRIQPA